MDQQSKEEEGCTNKERRRKGALTGEGCNNRGRKRNCVMTEERGGRVYQQRKEEERCSDRRGRTKGVVTEEGSIATLRMQKKTKRNEYKLRQIRYKHSSFSTKYFLLLLLVIFYFQAYSAHSNDTLIVGTTNLPTDLTTTVIPSSHAETAKCTEEGTFTTLCGICAPLTKKYSTWRSASNSRRRVT